MPAEASTEFLLRKIFIFAGALLAGTVLSPEVRAGLAHPTGWHSADDGEIREGRAAARKLRRHGFWGFGKERFRGGHLYLQAYWGRGEPVMVKIALESGRVVAAKRFAHRHVRHGVAIAGGPLPLARPGRTGRGRI